MLGSDKVATAAYVGKLFKDYDELKMAFLQGHDWLSTLAAEYNEAYTLEQNVHKVRIETELKQLQMIHEDRMRTLDRKTSREQKSALIDKYQTDRRTIQKKFHDHRACIHKHCLQRLARPPSPPPQEVLPNYSLMDNDWSSHTDFLVVCFF